MQSSKTTELEANQNYLMNNVLKNISFFPFTIGGSATRTITKYGTEMWIFITRGITGTATIVMIDTWNAIAINSTNSNVEVTADGSNITFKNLYTGMVRCLAIHSTP